MNSLQQYGPLVARVFLGLIFIMLGYGKIGSFDGTAQFISSAGLPMAEVVLVLTIITELIGGIMLVLGYKTRLAATALFLFVLLAAFLFHFEFPAQQTAFLKNVAIAGGMLMLMVHGAGPLSIDNKKMQTRRTEGDQKGEVGENRSEERTRNTDRVDTPPLT